MNKNHFFISYCGNKRNEFNKIYESIKDKLNDIEYIVEPFCGTSAFSYFLSLKHPKQFKYILNDNCKNLIDCYEIFQDPDKLNSLIEKLNTFLIDIDKEKYVKIIKIDDIPNWFLKHKLYNIRPGLYNTNNNKKDYNELVNTPIINFLRTENITLSNIDAIELFNKYQNNNKAFIFLDPPYLQACNSFYNESNTNIYEYLLHNNINGLESKIILVLEDNWIIKLLFKDNIKDSYNKRYEKSGKKTNHLLINNFI